MVRLGGGSGFSILSFERYLDKLFYWAPRPDGKGKSLYYRADRVASLSLFSEFPRRAGGKLITL